MILRRMGAEDAPQLIEFEAMVGQLDRAAAAVAVHRRSGPPPAATYKQGTLAIAIESSALTRDSFFAVLEILQKYMKAFSEFKPGFGGVTLVADVFTTYARKPPRTGSATTPLPAPFEVAFSFDSSGQGGKVTFSKDSLLMQEELNCVLDVWRRVAVFGGDEATDPGTAPIAYDAMVAQLAAAAERDLANVGKALHNGGPPQASFRQGNLAIELRFATLTRESFFPVLDILGKYMRAFTELRPGSSSCTIVADRTGGLRKRAGTIKIDFQFDPRGSGKIVLTKDSLLYQDEVNCVLEVWRKLAIRQSAEDGPTRDPRAALAELGAVVFDPDPAFHAGRIAGYEATKRDIHETVVLPLLDPTVFVEIAKLTRGQARASVPRAVLFEGPPGTGKTTMARVIATAAGVPMVYVPVESIMSKWFGESERRLDAIFDLAGALERSIVFLDEIDAFAGSRDGQMHEGTRRILSVLLRQMQGLVETSNVMVVGATNRAADLDAALLNRFARAIEFPLPNAAERAAIVKSYARQLADGDIAQIAALAEGASGRRLEDACGAAERLWAARLITSKAPVTPPPIEVYLEAFRTIT